MWYILTFSHDGGVEGWSLLEEVFPQLTEGTKEQRHPKTSMHHRRIFSYKSRDGPNFAIRERILHPYDPEASSFLL